MATITCMSKSHSDSTARSCWQHKHDTWFWTGLALVCHQLKSICVLQQHNCLMWCRCEVACSVWELITIICFISSQHQKSIQKRNASSLHLLGPYLLWLCFLIEYVWRVQVFLQCCLKMQWLRGPGSSHQSGLRILFDDIDAVQYTSIWLDQAHVIKKREYKYYAGITCLCCAWHPIWCDRIPRVESTPISVNQLQPMRQCKDIQLGFHNKMQKVTLCLTTCITALWIA